MVATASLAVNDTTAVSGAYRYRTREPSTLSRQSSVVSSVSCRVRRRFLHKTALYCRDRKTLSFADARYTLQ